MSTFGQYFRVTTYGESHCKGIGGVVDGVPPRLPLTEEDIQPQVSRRRPGQSKLTTARNEADRVTIMSGTEFGKTLGTPIGLAIANKDQRPGDYSAMSKIPRPSHADYTYQCKYGTHASSGGGRSSARETAVRVAAGAIAEKWLSLRFGVEIVAFVSAVGGVEVDSETANELVASVTRDLVDGHFSRCPSQAHAEKMAAEVLAAREADDSVGGVVTCVVRNLPAGLGEPCFDRLDAKLAHAMISIPATKGFELGSGFAGARLRGSQHNDPFVVKEGGRIGTATNNSGGVQGGISNGEAVVFRVAFKPPATIGRAQPSVTFAGDDTVLEAKGRHDPCVVPRAVPIVEAMAALVVADLAMGQLARSAAVLPDAVPCFEGLRGLVDDAPGKRKRGGDEEDANGEPAKKQAKK